MYCNVFAENQYLNELFETKWDYYQILLNGNIMLY
jgi:hypothetical protein